MNVYPIYCQRCGKMLGVVVGSARVKCPICGDWIITGGGEVKEKMLLIKATKCLLVVPESRLIKLLIEAGEFEEAIRRGKAYRRQQRFKEMISGQK